jgi:aerobic carbon-monoxide dehydrogenase small subunit
MKAVAEPTDALEIELSVNGEAVRRTVPVRRLLVDFLRDDLGLTGTHVGCEHGVCGACTILMNSAPVRSCIMLAVQAEGAELTTVEGITPAEGLNRMQQAFKENHGLQCGFCTPGFLMTLQGVDPADYPNEESIRAMLSGNLCRCTGYQGIVAAVNDAWGRNETSAEQRG